MEKIVCAILPALPLYNYLHNVFLLIWGNCFILLRPFIFNKDIHKDKDILCVYNSGTESIQHTCNICEAYKQHMLNIHKTYLRHPGLTTNQIEITTTNQNIKEGTLVSNVIFILVHHHMDKED